jgi:hypothetical protein
LNSSIPTAAIAIIIEKSQIIELRPQVILGERGYGQILIPSWRMALLLTMKIRELTLQESLGENKDASVPNEKRSLRVDKNPK